MNRWISNFSTTYPRQTFFGNDGCMSNSNAKSKKILPYCGSRFFARLAMLISHIGAFFALVALRLNFYNEAGDGGATLMYIN